MATPSPGASSIFAATPPHPIGGVLVPLVAVIVDRTECPRDVAPTPLLVERALDCMCDEGASLPAPRNTIQLAHQSVIQTYV